MTHLRMLDCVVAEVFHVYISVTSEGVRRAPVYSLPTWLCTKYNIM